MGASYPTKLLLAYRSGDVCALPACRCRLTPNSTSGGPTNVGEAAHIEGEHDGKGTTKKSARFNPDMSDKERNHFSNLIYLCGVCHTKIDTIPQGEIDYPVEKLKKIKLDHESKVREAILEAFANVGFAELQEATNSTLSHRFGWVSISRRTLWSSPSFAQVGGISMLVTYAYLFKQLIQRGSFSGK